ncbi:hypothetical protein [Haloarcula montana]|uniref:hypothetical protein n=1 Tax=Haloarcula montana TaxID=3111776 RepID=UPI002D79C152|nr:hypothetical protein [Haloarcula sp. GH36]
MVLEWVVEFVPGWLGPTVIVLGLFVCSIGLFRSGLRQLFTGVSSNFEYLVPGLAGLVYVWAMTNLLALPGFVVRNPTTYAILFAFSAKWIEGASAVIIYPKLAYVVRNFSEVRRTWSTPGQTTMTQKLLRGLVLFLLGMIAFYAFIGALLYVNGLSVPAGNLLVVVWTVLTFAISLFGLFWKVSTVDLPAYLLYGTVLVLSGAEVVNLSSIGGDISVFVAGGAGYTLGYLTLLLLWVLPDGTLTADPEGRRD